MMENENISSYVVEREVVHIPMKKALSILGFGLALSIIAWVTVQFVVADFVKNSFPDVYQSDVFRFAIGSVPLVLVALPILFWVTSFILSVKTSYRSNISIAQLAKIFAISYVGVMIINMATLLVNGIISVITNTTQINPLEQMIGDTNIWLTIVFVVIIAPIVEEIMFRHIIINKLRKYGSGIAIFTSAFAFGLYHGNLFQMFYAFGIGLVLATTLYKTGRLRYAIILHIAINFIGSVLPLGLLSPNPLIVGLCMLGLFGLVGTGFVLGIITLCKTDYARLKMERVPKGSMKAFFLNAGIIVFIITILAMVARTFIG